MNKLDNLARRNFDYAADKKVKEELQIARIPIISLPYHMEGEVKTYYFGLLNGFLFHREWTYWVCTGNIPLEIAEEIYREDKELCIRAGGHCGHVAPKQVAHDPIYDNMCSKLRDEWGLETYLKIVAAVDDSEKYNKSDAKFRQEIDKLREQERIGEQFVSSYHIDTQFGLCTLARIIKERKLQVE